LCCFVIARQTANKQSKYMNPILDLLLRNELSDREQTGLLRRLTVHSKNLSDFSSNDYLGLAASSELGEIIEVLVRKSGAENGSTGSRLLTGNSAFAEETEAFLARVLHTEAALLFNSGYTANLAVLSALPKRHDTILYDELAHACIKDGARLSMAKRFSFRHNNMEDLETKLRKSTGNIFIAVESIYSMDGDECPLADLTSLAHQYNAFIILDEAHSTGVMGEEGSGMAVALGLHNRIAARIHTFGKAMGVHGACVAGSETLVNYLINFARPFIYTTALSPHNIVSINCAFRYLKEHKHLQDALHANVELFLDTTRDVGNKTASHSAIQTVIVPGNSAVRNAATILQRNGLDVRPILSPTVTRGKERLRICLHAFNTPAEVRKLTEALNRLADGKNAGLGLY
jgi:8-amino-7-oxononanoate synthase